MTRTGIAEDVFNTMQTEPCVYSVPSWEEPEEQREIMSEFWPALFEAMLNAWVTDEALWPASRTQKMFDEWFDIETHSMLEDVYMDEAIGYVE